MSREGFLLTHSQSHLGGGRARDARPYPEPAEVSPMAKRVISMSSELQLLIEGVGGIYALNRRFIENFGMEAELPENISSLLAILIERLRLLDRAVRGAVDPRLAWCIENDAFRHGDPGETDLVLPEFTEKQAAQHHRAHWKRARLRLRSKKRSKASSEEGASG